jgi:hypothetical protein
MRNPFRSERDAFRFVWIVLGAAGLVAVGAWINGWLGVAVFLVVLGAGIWWIFQSRPPEPPVVQQPPPSPPGEHRILVVANETVGGPELLAQVREHAGGRTAVVRVVSPALNSQLKTWTSDEDGARATAQERLDASVA